MHGHNIEEFYRSVAPFLGSYYLFLSILNFGAWLYLWQTGRGRRLLGISTAWFWLVLSLFFLIISPIAYSGRPYLMELVSVPHGVRDAVNGFMGPWNTAWDR